jgi:putative ABC transport system permease protein
MSWRNTAAKILSFFRREKMDRALDEEIRAHLDLEEAEQQAAGLPSEEARHAARRAFGNVTLAREDTLDTWLFRLLEDFFEDIRYGLRTLAKNPGFAAVAIFTLALGIGANTAIFSVIDALFLRPLSYGDPQRLVVVWENNRPRSRVRNTVGPANFLVWQEKNTVFEQMGILYDHPSSITGEGEPEQVPAQAISPNLMSLLGVSPIRGRSFSEDDGQPGRENVVLISYGVWQRRFAGDPRIVGRSIRVDDVSKTVVGVMPRGFEFFLKNGSLSGEKAQLWNPIVISPAWRTPQGRFLTSVARLKPGVSLAQAQAEMNAIAASLERKWPDFDTGWGVNLVPLTEELTGDLRKPLGILFAAVGLVLLIACANVANLLLARAATRHKEMAVRTALGAGRNRIFRQLLAESLVLSIAGGAAGFFLSIWGIRALISISPRNIVDLSGVGPDFRILAFTMIVSILTGLLFGVAPALSAFRVNFNSALKEGGRASSLSGSGAGLRTALVVSEIAFAFILLVGGGLLARSFLRLTSVNPGFDPHNLLTVKLTLPSTRNDAGPRNLAFFRELRDRFAALPGVRAASGNCFLPFTGLASATSFEIVGRPKPPAGEEPGADVRMIEPDYFRAMGIPLLKGRLFTEREHAEATRVVIINETMARQFFPNEDPTGKRVIIDMKQENLPNEIVGVVGDVKHYGFDSTVRPMTYWPHSELPMSLMNFVLRTDSDPMSVAPAVRQVIASMNKDLPITRLATMEDLLADSVARERFNTVLLSIFAGAALLLSVIGVYGLMAYSVTQRTQEIGIRMALGAQSALILRMVLRQASRLFLLGIAAGFLGALACTRLLGSLLFDLKPTDPLTFCGVAVALAAAALLASLIPARRATIVDPVVALRFE